MIQGFLHAGFEVDDMESAIEFYQKMGFVLDKQFDKPEPKAKAAKMTSSTKTSIELWQFFDKDHPQVEFIRRHIAVESDDLDKDVDMLLDAGGKLVIPKTKGVTLTYAFVKDSSGNFIEVAQR